MQVKFANKISAEELKALPSGTVISFGDFYWEKLGILWMDFYGNEYETEGLTAAVDEERVAMEIRAFMHLYPDKYPQFSIITPYDEEAFGNVVWSEPDIEKAFEQLDYKMTPERKNAVLNKVKPVIEDAMTSLGWSVIYDAVDEVCEDEDD